MSLGYAEVRLHFSQGEDSPFPNKSAAWADKGVRGNTAFPKSTKWVSNRSGVSIRALFNLWKDVWHLFCHSARSCSASVRYREGSPTFPAQPCKWVRVCSGELLPGYLAAAYTSLGAYICSLSLLCSLVMGKLPGALLKYNCLILLWFGHA